METVVRLNGVAELVLDRLVSRGYFQTRTEALRAGGLELGKEYGIMNKDQDMDAELLARKMEKIRAEINSGKRKTTPLSEVLAEYGLAETELK